MSQRIAAISSLLVFAACLIGGIAAENTFNTTVSRALAGMAATFVIGLIVGAMAQRMADERKQAEEEKRKNKAMKTQHPDR